MKLVYSIAILLIVFPLCAISQPSSGFQMKIDSGFTFGGVRSSSDSTFLVAFTDSVNNFHISKMDEGGNLVWSKVISNYGLSFHLEPNGEILLSGSVYPYDYKTHLIKLSPNGNFLWGRTYSNISASVHGWNFAPTNDGGYLMAGYLDDTWVSGKQLISFIKTNANGDLQWEKSFNYTSQGLFWGPFRMFQRSSNEFLLGFYARPNPINLGGNGIINIDSLGNIRFAKSYYDTSFSQLNIELTMTRSGKIVMPFGKGAILLDSGGNILQGRSFNFQPNDANFASEIYAAQENENGGFVFSAYHAKQIGGTSNWYSKGNIIATDSTLKPLWVLDVKDSLVKQSIPPLEYPIILNEAIDGSIFYSENNTFGKFSSNGVVCNQPLDTSAFAGSEFLNIGVNSHSFILDTFSIMEDSIFVSVQPSTLNPFSLNCSGLTFLDNNFNFPQPGVFPNPASDQLTISGNAILYSSLYIFNSLGKGFIVDYKQEGENLIVDTSQLAPGLYILKISDGERQFTEKVLIK